MTHKQLLKEASKANPSAPVYYNTNVCKAYAILRDRGFNHVQATLWVNKRGFSTVTEVHPSKQ